MTSKISFRIQNKIVISVFKIRHYFRNSIWHITGHLVYIMRTCAARWRRHALYANRQTSEN